MTATRTGLTENAPCTGPHRQELQVAAFAQTAGVSPGQLPVMVLGMIQAPLLPDTRRALLAAFPGASRPIQEELIATFVRNDAPSLEHVPWASIQPYVGFYGAARAGMLPLDRRAATMQILVQSPETSAWAAAVALARRLPREHALRSYLRGQSSILRKVRDAAFDERIASEVDDLLE